MDRIDPVKILARVSEHDGKQRAFDVWVRKATKSGWTVVVESASADEPGPVCGIVEIEGLRYRILHDKRVRRRAAILPAGGHPVEAAARLSAGRTGRGNDLGVGVRPRDLGGPDHSALTL